MTTKEQYDEIFYQECVSSYPEVTAFELGRGHAVGVTRLQDAARVLACPLKVNPPSWAHGRVIYAAARRLLDEDKSAGLFLDIGTAKGFSAVVAGWVVSDAQTSHQVVSVDVVDPFARVARNSVAEVDGVLLTVPDFVAPFRASNVDTRFFGGGSLPLLKSLKKSNTRVRFAFVDGKHTLEAVTSEMFLLGQLQQKGDVTVLDDLQITQVDLAVSRLRGYDVTTVRAGPLRRYAVAVRQ